MGERISVIDRVETDSRVEIAADWARRVESMHQDGTPYVPSEMIAELEGMAPRAEYALAQLDLILEPETDVKTGDVTYRIAPRRNSRGAQNG